MVAVLLAHELSLLLREGLGLGLGCDLRWGFDGSDLLWLLLGH